MRGLRLRSSASLLALSCVALSVLPGCARGLVQGHLVTFAKADLDSAVLVANASRDAGLLPDTDAWGVCASSLATGLGKIQQGVGVTTPANGLFTEAMRLHVLDTVARNAPPALKAACGQVFFDLMLRAAQRAPGL